MANHFIVLKRIDKNNRIDSYNTVNSEIINLKKDVQKNTIRFYKGMVKKEVKGSIIGHFYR